MRSCLGARTRSQPLIVMTSCSNNPSHHPYSSPQIYTRASRDSGPGALTDPLHRIAGGKLADADARKGVVGTAAGQRPSSQGKEVAMAMWRWHPCVVGGLLLLLLSAAIQVREVIAGGKCDIELKSTQDQIQDALLDLNEHATILHVEIPKGGAGTAHEHGLQHAHAHAHTHARCTRAVRPPPSPPPPPPRPCCAPPPSPRARRHLLTAQRGARPECRAALQ